jgi:chromatin remodeling complex protein RSC6
MDNRILKAKIGTKIYLDVTGPISEVSGLVTDVDDICVSISTDGNDTIDIPINVINAVRHQKNQRANKRTLAQVNETPI